MYNGSGTNKLCFSVYPLPVPPGEGMCPRTQASRAFAALASPRGSDPSVVRQGNQSAASCMGCNVFGRITPSGALKAMRHRRGIE